MFDLNLANWYAIYTKPRHEKFIEKRLIEKGIEAYTPKAKIRKKWSDRVVLIEEPIFKSYCFAKFKLKDKLKILSCDGVVDLVHFNRHYIPIEESVINSIKILLENNIRLDPYPYLKEGDRVVIKRGPLKGVEGYIIEKRNKNSTIVISVDAICASVSCIVDVDFVELV